MPNNLQRAIYPPKRALEEIEALHNHLDLTAAIMVFFWASTVISSTPSSTVYSVPFGLNPVCIKETSCYQLSWKTRDLRVRRELAISYALEHPNIIRLLGICTLNQNLCLVYPYVSGGCLMDYILVNPDVNRIQIMMKIADAVAYMHGRNVIHGDIKAQNVLIDNTNGLINPLLCDFGSSFCLDVLGTLDAPLDTLGTPPFMAPELHSIRDDDPCIPTKASDVWALGMTIYQIYVRQEPYFDYPPLKVPYLIATGALPTRPPVDTLASFIPDNIWNLVLQCWDADPSLRPTSAQVADRLTSIWENPLV